MIDIQVLFKKVRVIEEKRDAQGNIREAKQVEITFNTEFDQLTDAEFANITLAQAHKTYTDVSLSPKQLVLGLHNSITPAEE